MFEQFFTNVDVGTFLFLGVACFIAAFIDAIAGGGGLITVPAYLASGLPAHIALGTNKVSSSIGTVASSLKFATSGKVNKEMVKRMIPFSFIGALMGVRTVVLIDSKYLYPIAIVLLLLVLVYTLINKKMGEKNNFTGLNKSNIRQGKIMAFVMGFYDGFFGPGTGSFIIFALIKIFKLDFTNASGNAKILNLTSNLASMLLFIYLGKVNFFYSIPIGIIMVFGATLGAKMAVSKGTSFIKPIFLVVTTIVLVKMILESMFGIDVVGFLKELILSVL
ncbi:MAG: TSUP family transporter [Fusobacterium perfoetens]|uniref:sulfite exporter TauE/SafE family protein n=1 Tax=Fusobacterium perfoetens TaxID=852 RepID=UPI0023F4E18E|nr:TSUP family transporter [Fusobacterium perfoetens]MCI6151988.1 TSUP family transporter [Fusobacterium perfoetens]MDY3237901.1 TSUP family transporter [Fusobacterium perfoetens]